MLKFAISEINCRSLLCITLKAKTMKAKQFITAAFIGLVCAFILWAVVVLIINLPALAVALN